ncbi:MAG TPA: efflux RND transporter periplasmic adaptor subunit [Polyangia bacterium]|nr:efflux RND transporter periplasmic adaptor subunit [Polyangia bacterium]
MSHDALAPPPGRTPPLSGRKALVVVAVLIGVALVIAILGIVPRVRARATLQQQTDLLAAPDVLVARPALGNVAQEVVLPGNVQAFTDAPIYARTSGYLKSWSFDLGAHVKKGQRLAVIASPEVDQQLQQAKADVATAKANSKYAETQSTRYQDLLNENAVSKQDTDNFRAQANSTSNQVAAAEANVRRLAQLTGFESVVAPFDGVITARNVDLGTLIDAGAARELFHLAADDVLRVYVNVPQIYSREMVLGQTAGLTVPEHPGRTFAGKIVRTASAIDPAFRTLLVEIEVDNHKHELFPGAYAQVHFKLASRRPTLVLPVPTLIFRSEGLRVAVARDGKARLIPITIGRDDGKTVEVSEGLQPSDLVIQNPPDSIIDGEAVHVVAPETDGRIGPGPAKAESRHAGSKHDGTK